MINSLLKVCVAGCLSAGVVAVAANAASAPAPKLLPHSAGYTMQVLPVSQSGAIAGGRGILQLEWRLDCDGVSYSQQSFLTLRNTEGGTVDSAIRIDSWEAADASSYRFLLESGIDGEMTEDVNGLAKRDGSGGITVRYTKPEEKVRKLPASTLFPWQQMRHTFALANSGVQQDWHSILRGEATGDPARVSMHILGNAGPPDDTEELGDQGDLLPPLGWQISSAFFEDEVDSQPSFEILETMLASGVITKAEITYPDMILRLRLQRLVRAVAGQHQVVR